MAHVPAKSAQRLGAGFGQTAKRKGWLESARIFLYVGFPIGFAVLQAQPEVMGWVIQNREYVRFPAEAKDSDADIGKIKRTAKILEELSKQEKNIAAAPMTQQLQSK